MTIESKLPFCETSEQGLLLLFALLANGVVQCMIDLVMRLAVMCSLVSVAFRLVFSLMTRADSWLKNLSTRSFQLSSHGKVTSDHIWTQSRIRTVQSAAQPHEHLGEIVGRDNYSQNGDISMTRNASGLLATGKLGKSVPHRCGDDFLHSIRNFFLTIWRSQMFGSNFWRPLFDHFATT